MTGFLGTQNFGFTGGGGSGGPAPATPSWQAVTDVGNTTNKDIFVTVSGNDYLKVDKTTDSYFLGDGANVRGVSLNPTIQRYLFGEVSGPYIQVVGGATPLMQFAGTDVYQFNDGIAPYASGLYKALVLNQSASPDEMQIQPKDLLPERAEIADYNATVDDCIILVDTTSAGADINIHLPNTVLPGKRFFVKKNGGAFNVIITPASGNIDGAASQTISTLYETLEMGWDGTNYWIL